MICSLALASQPGDLVGSPDRMQPGQRFCLRVDHDLDERRSLTATDQFPLRLQSNTSIDMAKVVFELLCGSRRPIAPRASALTSLTTGSS